MQYVLYIDYQSSYKSFAYEYRPLKAKSLSFAILEADAIHDMDTMYLIRIMAKSGIVQKVQSDVKVQTFLCVLEKRSTKWISSDGHFHTVRHFVSKFADWYE